MAWPPAGFTLRWFGEALANPTILQAFVNSILAALAAVAIALVLGTLAAMAVQRYSFFGRSRSASSWCCPSLCRACITGIALSTTFQTFGIEFGLMTIVIGHATFCVVIAYNNVIARLRRLPRSPEEASADLGADTWITFRGSRCPGCGRHCCPARFSPLRSRSTRSSSRCSRPARERRPSRSGSFRRCSGRPSCRWSTSSRSC